MSRAYPELLARNKVPQEIEVITGDSKLSALGTLLDHLKEKRTPVQRICVLTHFRATLFYLSAEIEGRGNDYCLLHGEMHALGGKQSLDSFLSRETILVATTAIMTAGVNLSEVTDLVLYDIPGNRNTLQQVLGRFQRLGRRSGLDVYVLKPSNASDSPVTESVGILRDFLGLPKVS